MVIGRGVARIRDAVPTDVLQAVAVDPAAVAGDDGRRSDISRWIAERSMRVAVTGEEKILGHCVTQRAFFGHAFVVMLMVAEDARRQGIGAGLLLDAQRHRATAKLFTSTNLSNQPMQRLLARLGWRSVGIVYELDEGDPELFFFAPPRGLTLRQVLAQVELAVLQRCGERLPLVRSECQYRPAPVLGVTNSDKP